MAIKLVNNRVLMRNLRENTGLSMRAVERQTRIDRHTLRRLEHEHFHPDLDVIERLGRFYKVNPIDLLITLEL